MYSTIFTVFKKEMIDLYRDKKTIIFGLLIPLLMFPLIFGIMGHAIKSSQESVQNNLKIELTDPSNSSLGNFIKNQKNINLVKSSNPTQDVKDGKIYLAIEIPNNFDEEIKSETQTNIKVIYDNSSENSSTALAIINSTLDAYSKVVVNQRLQERKINTDILTPVNMVQTSVEKDNSGTAKLILAMILPLMLVIYSVTGPMSSAIDLGVGEKERGTLEPLLTTKAGRLSMLWGKFLAITVIGVQTSIASILGLYISMKQNSSIFAGAGSSISSAGISIPSLIIIAIFITLMTMVFGALELSLSIYAKSFKEASTYTSPLMIVAMVPTYATYMLDAKNISFFYFSIPIANVCCILKELISGIYNVPHLLITFAWILVYVMCSILFARYMFSREDVIFRT